MDADAVIKALVQKVVPEGKHGPFAVATSEGLEGSVTFSLEPTIWQEQEWPEEGMYVLLGKLRQKRAGWRAKTGRFFKPSDEQTERSKQMETIVYEINENPATGRGLDTSLVAKMEAASAELRAKEVVATNNLIARYESHIKYCDEYFKNYHQHPGGWNSVFAMKDAVTQIAIEAVSVENQVMFREQWLSGAWQSETWASEMIAILKQESKDNSSYYKTRFVRWELWQKNGGSPGRALEDKKMEYVVRRNQSIDCEIQLLTQLGKFAEELNKGNLPDPDSTCVEANAYLTFLYKQRLEQK